jgi:hypothetical protein
MRAVVHGKHDAAGGNQEANERSYVHLNLPLGSGELRFSNYRDLSVRKMGWLIRITHLTYFSQLPKIGEVLANGFYEPELRMSKIMGQKRSR